MMAFLIGAYGPFYGQSIAEQGYEDVVGEIRAAWEDRDLATMTSALPDDLSDGIAAAGTPEEVLVLYIPNNDINSNINNKCIPPQGI